MKASVSKVIPRRVRRVRVLADLSAGERQLEHLLDLVRPTAATRARRGSARRTGGSRSWSRTSRWRKLPEQFTRCRDRPISSSASRSAVSVRSASPGSRRPPGKEISPAWRRRSARRLVKTAWGSLVRRARKSGTSTAAWDRRLPAHLIDRVRTGRLRRPWWTRSTRSWNMTSPSSTRWTGHFAAITRRRSTCSSGRSSGRRMHQLELRRAAALGGACTRRRPRRDRCPSPCARRTSPS